MKTIKENVKQSEKGRIFNIYVGQKDQDFATLLKHITEDCKLLFTNIEFNFMLCEDIENFRLKDLDKMNLVFIEDGFLLSVPKQKIINATIKQDVVLLLDGHFIGEEAYKIKKIISEFSLNLTGHISLTNYPYNLVKLLVIDLIKSKLRLYGRE